MPRSVSGTYQSHRAWPGAYRSWVAPLLGLPMAVSLLITLVGILMIAFPEANDVSGQRETGAIVAIFFLAISGFLGFAVVGIVRDKPWGRGVATAAALFIALTGAGILIAAPVLWGLWRSPRWARASGVALPRASSNDADVFQPAEIGRALDRALKVSRSRLPVNVCDKVAKIRLEILALLPHTASFPTGSRDLFVIQRTATDYLPASLDAYLSLPADYATTIEVAGGRTSLQLLEDQLDLLDRKMGEIADAVRNQDAERLLVHGRFLEDQFGGGSADFRLPPLGKQLDEAT
jgi:hypothetical protein